MESCSAILQNAFCNMTTERCECLHEFPVVIDNLICEKPRRLDQLCRYDRVCQFFDENTECRSLSDSTAPRCRCRQFHQATSFRSATGHMYCIKDPFSQLLRPDPSTVVSLILVLSAMMLLICMALRLFHRARHIRARGYGDASHPPPLTCSDLDLSRRVHSRLDGGGGQVYRSVDEDPCHVTAASRLCNGHVPQAPGLHLLQVQDDEFERRLSGSSAHSSFSTCTYGLPESVANKIRAQKQMLPRTQMSNGQVDAARSHNPTPSSTPHLRTHTDRPVSGSIPRHGLPPHPYDLAPHTEHRQPC